MSIRDEYVGCAHGRFGQSFLLISCFDFLVPFGADNQSSHCPERVNECYGPRGVQILPAALGYIGSRCGEDIGDPLVIAAPIE